MDSNIPDNMHQVPNVRRQDLKAFGHNFTDRLLKPPKVYLWPNKTRTWAALGTPPGRLDFKEGPGV